MAHGRRPGHTLAGDAGCPRQAGGWRLLHLVPRRTVLIQSGYPPRHEVYPVERAGEPLRFGALRLVRLTLPRERDAFWAEVGAAARRHAGAELSLMRLEGRPTLLLAREPGVRAELAAWARYVTDLMPQARSMDAGPDVLALVVEGLAEQPRLEDDVLALLEEGSHLLVD